MGKPAFCICENKDADQLRGNREAHCENMSMQYTAIFHGCKNEKV